MHLPTLKYCITYAPPPPPPPPNIIIYPFKSESRLQKVEIIVVIWQKQIFSIHMLHVSSYQTQKSYNTLGYH